MRGRWRLSLCAVCCVLCAGVTACESLQRKFARKPKHATAAPSPIISFQDYSRAMTPLDRYRKHYLMFDYWNEELIEALQGNPINPKRFKRASSEALEELKTMSSLVVADVAARLAPLIEERATIDHDLQSTGFNTSQANVLGRTLEAQTRQIHREFFWRDVEDHLKPQGHPVER